MELVKDLGMITDSFDKRYQKWSRKHYGLFKCPYCGAEVKAPYSKGIQRGSCAKCAGILRTKHGAAVRDNSNKYSKLYHVWQSMKQRCYNPKSQKYSIYGAKGIKVCDAWLTWEGFLKDNKDKYKEGLTIDRIDSNKDYCPENIQWVPLSENSSRTCKKKAVNQFRQEMLPNKHWVFVKRWDSALQAATALNLIPQHITRCCQHNSQSHGGYHWEYAEDSI